MVTCVENLSCFPPQNLDELFALYEYQVGIPSLVVLALLVGMIILAIYIRTRSLAHLSVLGIYAISIFGTMAISDQFLTEQIRMAAYIIVLCVASVIVMLVLKLIKE